MNRENENAASVGIIGSADGPTSMLIAGKKPPLKVRIRNYLHQRRRNLAAKTIVAGTHTLEEMLAYAASTYGATEAKNNGDDQPAISHTFEIKVGSNCLAIEIDDTRETFGVSFAGSKKEMKQAMTIARDLYLYNGVSEKDIQERTERYYALLGVLST